MNNTLHQPTTGGDPVSAATSATRHIGTPMENKSRRQMTDGVPISPAHPELPERNSKGPPGTGEKRDYRKREEMKKDIDLVERWWLEGMSIKRIAEELEVMRGKPFTEDSVSYTLKLIRNKRHSNQELELERLRNLRLHQLGHWLEEAEQAWDRSKKDELTKVLRTVVDPITHKPRDENIESGIPGVYRFRRRDGNPKFITLGTEIIRTMMKIEGTAPLRSDSAGNNGHTPVGANGAAVLGASNDKPSSNEPSCEKSE